MRTDYISQVLRLLQETYARQQETLQTAATWIADALASDGVLYVFGASHAGIITEELTYRAGGLVPVSPIFIPGLTCDVRPLPLTSVLERIDGYALAAVKHIPISPSDVVLVHSVSGRNAAPVEVALYAKQQGAKVIALTALDYSQSVSPRSSTGYRLFEVADLVIDNGAPGRDCAATWLPAADCASLHCVGRGFGERGGCRSMRDSAGTRHHTARLYVGEP
jgi:uncharacterized phosphosugar-binding protein